MGRGRGRERRKSNVIVSMHNLKCGDLCVSHDLNRKKQKMNFIKESIVWADGQDNGRIHQDATACLEIVQYFNFSHLPW